VKSILGFWLFYALTVVARAFLGSDPLTILVNKLSVIAIGIVVTGLIYLAIAAFSFRQAIRRKAIVAAVASLLGAVAMGGTLVLIDDYMRESKEELRFQAREGFTVIEKGEQIRIERTAQEPVVLTFPKMHEFDPMKRFRFALDISVTWLFFFLAWSAFYLANQVQAEVHGAERRAAEAESAAQAAQVRALRYQVNPHFLFNCFNTLSSLISEDRKQAEVFLNELSKVYRYLLRNNEDGLSTLQTEIRFIESYYQLLKTRHGDAVQLEIEIDKKYDQYLLPSLSLQLLLENAVKHNVLSKNKPLVIDIFTTTGNKLVVSNTLQTRSIKGPSNKIGLENIRNKYELLSQPGFQVLEDKTSFSVVLPLIWNKITQQKLVSNEFIIKPWK
jgi:hypothetical protein